MQGDEEKRRESCTRLFQDQLRIAAPKCRRTTWYFVSLLCGFCECLPFLKITPDRIRDSVPKIVESC